MSPLRREQLRNVLLVFALFAGIGYWGAMLVWWWLVLPLIPVLLGLMLWLAIFVWPFEDDSGEALR